MCIILLLTDILKLLVISLVKVEWKFLLNIIESYILTLILIICCIFMCFIINLKHDKTIHSPTRIPHQISRITRRITNLLLNIIKTVQVETGLDLSQTVSQQINPTQMYIAIYCIVDQKLSAFLEKYPPGLDNMITADKVNIVVDELDGLTEVAEKLAKI